MYDHRFRLFSKNSLQEDPVFQLPKMNSALTVSMCVDAG